MNGEDYFRNSSEESESEIRSVVSDSLWPCGLYSPWNSPGRNTGVGCLSLLQGIFPIQGWNSGLLHCRRILHQLSHKGSPGTLLLAFSFFLFFFPFKVKICCPKARRPFTLYSLFRCSLFVYNVLSFLTQERFPNYYLHPFLSPKYKPSDLGILKRYYSFLK